MPEENPTRTPTDPLVPGLHDRLDAEEKLPKPNEWEGPNWPWLGMRATMVPCEICQGPHQYGEACSYCATWLTGSNWPKPCLRCGSRDHEDCYG